MSSPQPIFTWFLIPPIFSSVCQIEDPNVPPPWITLASWSPNPSNLSTLKFHLKTIANQVSSLLFTVLAKPKSLLATQFFCPCFFTRLCSSLLSLNSLISTSPSHTMFRLILICSSFQISAMIRSNLPRTLIYPQKIWTSFQPSLCLWWNRI